MKQCRLLERIANLGDKSSNQSAPADVLVGSILEHLRRILNTRQGSVPTDPLFGVPDFTNLAGSFTSGSTDNIALDISRMIQRYETRLKNVQVSFSNEQDDFMSLSFSIAGTISLDNKDIQIQLASSVAANGKISLIRQ